MASWPRGLVRKGGMGKRAESHLVWIDLEMTGLNPQENTILEIATLVTTNSLELLGEGPLLAIHQPGHILDAMDQWNRDHHGSSGLVERVLASAISMGEAEARTLAF